MTSTGLDRVHERLDQIQGSVGRVEIDVAVIRAENSAIKTSVAALTAGQMEHDNRIASLEHDRSKAFGALAGVAAAGAAGGAGLGAILRLFGVVP